MEQIYIAAKFEINSDIKLDFWQQRNGTYMLTSKKNQWKLLKCGVVFGLHKTRNVAKNTKSNYKKMKQYYAIIDYSVSLAGPM